MLYLTIGILLLAVFAIYIDAREPAKKSEPPVTAEPPTYTMDDYRRRFETLKDLVEVPKFGSATFGKFMSNPEGLLFLQEVFREERWNELWYSPDLTNLRISDLLLDLRVSNGQLVYGALSVPPDPDRWEPDIDRHTYVRLSPYQVVDTSNRVRDRVDRAVLLGLLRWESGGFSIDKLVLTEQGHSLLSYICERSSTLVYTDLLAAYCGIGLTFKPYKHDMEERLWRQLWETANAHGLSKHLREELKFKDFAEATQQLPYWAAAGFTSFVGYSSSLGKDKDEFHKFFVRYLKQWFVETGTYVSL